MASATLTDAAHAPADDLRLPTLRVLQRGALAAVAALAVNLLLRAVYVATLPADATAFFGLAPIPVAASTIIGVAGATLAFLVVRRLAREPVRAYRRVAAVGLALSLLPGLLMHLNPTPQGSMPLATMLALWSMHAATALVAVALLTRRA